MLSAALPPLSCLTLGFLYQEKVGATARRRCPLISSDAVAQPCFIPTVGIGLHGPSLTTIFDAVVGLGDDCRDLFEYARPVMSRNGWIVFELRQERYMDGLKLCVCNPMRGELFMIPPLVGADNPGDYACALYTGHDLGTPRPLSVFFRLLVVYNRRAFNALRSYSSDTGCWSIEAKRSWGPKIPSDKLRHLGQSIVVGGVAYWHLRCTTFAVRLDTLVPTEVCMSPSGPCIRDLTPGWCSLGVDLDGKLIFIDVALGEDLDPAVHKHRDAEVRSHHLTVATRAVFCPGSRDGGWSGEWERRGRCIRLKQLKVRYESIGEEKVPPFGDKINLRWFCEKSGNLLFTLGEGTGSPGTFVLSIATERVEKMSDGADCNSWRNFVGYEMDGAACLASILRRG